MDTKIRGNRRVRHIGWPTAIVGGLLLISLGLELLARQVFGQTDVGTLLWALYLGFWGFVLSTTGLLLLVIRWLILLAMSSSGPGSYAPRDLSRAEQPSYRETLVDRSFRWLQQGGLLSSLINRHGEHHNRKEAGACMNGDHSMRSAKSVKGSEDSATLAETPHHLV
jgi:hypothetical protein